MREKVPRDKVKEKGRGLKMLSHVGRGKKFEFYSKREAIGGFKRGLDL